MQLAFTKVYGSIFDSRVWDRPGDTPRVFLTLAHYSDPKTGIYHGTLPALARRANVPVEDTKAILDYLSTPDPNSKCQLDDGATVVPVLGGWRVPARREYLERRGRAPAPDALERTRARKAAWQATDRAKKKQIREDTQLAADQIAALKAATAAGKPPLMVVPPIDRQETLPGTESLEASSPPLAAVGLVETISTTTAEVTMGKKVEAADPQKTTTIGYQFGTAVPAVDAGSVPPPPAVVVGVADIEPDVSVITGEDGKPKVIRKKRVCKKKHWDFADYPPEQAVALTPGVLKVWAHYVANIAPKAKLSFVRRARIMDLLNSTQVFGTEKDYTPEEICEAFDGALKDTWVDRRCHMGIECLLRDTEQVDRLREMASPNIVVPTGPSKATEMKIRTISHEEYCKMVDNMVSTQLGHMPGLTPAERIARTLEARRRVTEYLGITDLKEPLPYSNPGPYVWGYPRR